MDYKEKYEQALERAKNILEFYKHPAYTEVYTYAKEDIPRIFPELAESEDEKIRKKLIDLFQSNTTQWFDEFTNKQFIDWLEKQGEQKPIDKIEPKFKVGDWITIKY